MSLVEKLQKLRKTFSHNDWLGVLGLFLLSRVIILLGFWAAGNQTMVQLALSGYRFLFNSTSPSGSDFAVHPFSMGQPADFTNFLEMWDGLWYLDIARFGYAYDGTTQHQSITFYPLFPLLSKALAWPLIGLGLSPEAAILLSGVVISNGLFLTALILLFLLVRQKSNPHVAWLTVALLALYPGSLFCSLFLSEACFLAFAIAFFLALERKRYLLAAFLSWPACLTRFNGVSLLPANLLALGKQLWKPAYAWLALIPLAGLLLYPVYLAWGFGDPLLYLKMHANYRGQWPVLKLSGLLGLLIVVWFFYSNDPFPRWKQHPTIRRIGRLGLILLLVGVVVFYATSALNLMDIPGVWNKLQNVLPVHLGPVGFATALGLVLFGLYQHQLNPAYKAYIVLNLFPLLFSGTFFSNHRYLILIFPLFWSLALGLEKHPVLGKVFCAIFAMLLLGLSVLYARMGWLMLF